MRSQSLLTSIFVLVVLVKAQPPTAAPTTIPTVDPTPGPTFQVVPTAAPTNAPTPRAWNNQESKERAALIQLYQTAGGPNWIVPISVGGHKVWKFQF